MSFSSDIKKEISKSEAGKLCCIMAELCAFVCFGATVSDDNGKFSLRISSESVYAAKRFVMLLKKAFKLTEETEIQKVKAGRGYIHVVNIEDDALCRRVFEETYLLDREFGERVIFRINENLLKKECCIRAFVRGAFLSCGSCAAPEKGYHTEFVTHHHNLIGDFASLMKNIGYEGKVVKRKSNYVLYYKGGDENEELLSLLGAGNCMMEYANVRIMKETRNNVNRKVNCDTANMNKSLNAAWQQLEAIKKIRKAGEFPGLSEQLKEIAVLREKNPEAPLLEIANMVNPPLSKSGTTHRLAKLVQIADGIKE